MIYVDKESVNNTTFVSLLEDTKVEMVKGYTKRKSVKIDGDIFETAVYNQMLVSAYKTEFDGHVIQTGSHSFPDIIAKKLFGVEVKMTIGNKWVSTGNSVLETTRIGDVETIYMFFGKFGNEFDIKYRKYQECLYDVGVTHSPRYKIDMNLQEGFSIFDKLKVSYDVFRKEENSIKRLKEYYKKQLKPGEELWWITDSIDSMPASPIIKPFSKFDKAEKDKFIIECLILFPEIFGSSTTKFERCAAYLITNYNAVASNLRDYFTAGGQMTIHINGKPQRISKLLYKVFILAKDINNTLKTIPHTTLEYYWDTSISKSPLTIWKTLIQKYSGVVAIFNEGLQL